MLFYIILVGLASWRHVFLVFTHLNEWWFFLLLFLEWTERPLQGLNNMWVIRQPTTLCTPRVPLIFLLVFISSCCPLNRKTSSGWPALLQPEKSKSTYECLRVSHFYWTFISCVEINNIGVNKQSGKSFHITKTFSHYCVVMKIRAISNKSVIFIFRTYMRVKDFVKADKNKVSV